MNQTTLSGSWEVAIEPEYSFGALLDHEVLVPWSSIRDNVYWTVSGKQKTCSKFQCLSYFFQIQEGQIIFGHHLHFEVVTS